MQLNKKKIFKCVMSLPAMAQTSDDLKTFNNEVASRFSSYFSATALSSSGVLQLTATDRYSALTLIEKKEIMRSGAQLISYELSAGLALLTIVVLSGTMQFSQLIENQRFCWNVFNGHISSIIAFVIYLISGHEWSGYGNPMDIG